MTTTRTTSRRWARCAALALAAGVTLTLAPTAASAAPGDDPAAQPTTAAEASDLVTATGQQIEAAAEQIAQQQTVVADQQALAAVAATDAAAARARLDTLLPLLRAIAVSGTTSESQLSVMLTASDPGDLVQRLSLLKVLADHADGVVAQVAAAQDAATRAQEAATAAADAASAALADLAAQRESLEHQQDSYRSDFARLSASQQVRVTTSLSGVELASPGAAAAEAAPTEAARIAIATALDQLGDPYVTGAAGPDGFDCSGLTMFAFAAAGISLPHSSRAQSQLGTPVDRADLQPGDLVFFYSPVSHVGLYIGNGQMVHASVTGRPVAVTSVDKMGYVGARRVSG